MFFSPIKVIIIQSVHSYHNKKNIEDMIHVGFNFCTVMKNCFFVLSSFLCSPWSSACSLQQLRGHPDAWTLGGTDHSWVWTRAAWIFRPAFFTLRPSPPPPTKQQRLTGSALLAWVCKLMWRGIFWYSHILYQMQCFCATNVLVLTCNCPLIVIACWPKIKIIK